MATIPTPHEIVNAQQETVGVLEDKIIEQAKEGKGFIIEADGHGSGVIPEQEWKKLKVQS